MNYSPVSSEAMASTKGLPRRMLNQIEHNKSRIAPRPMTKSRGKNYRMVINLLLQTYKGLVITTGEEGKGKSRFTYIVVLTPNTAATAFCLMMYQVYFKDPMQDLYNELAINIRPHVVQRIFQRYAGTDHDAALAVLSALILIPISLDGAGTWELGTGNGMFIIETTADRVMQADVITWVDAEKLRPEQTVDVSAYRKID
jgi:hypothetical protein